MELWLDAHLPPSLSPWLGSTFGVTCRSFDELGFRATADLTVFRIAAARADVVIVSKDRDFPSLAVQHGAPPRVVWITCGNCRKAELREVFERTMEGALALLRAGEAVVEIS